MKKSLVLSFLKQHFSSSNVDANLTKCPTKVKKMGKLTKIVGNKKTNKKNQDLGFGPSQLVITFLFNVIWEKLTCPFIELMTPTILKTNHLRNVTDFRIHHGSLQEFETPQLKKGDSFISCHEKPCVLYIRGKEIENCVIKDPFDVFDSVRVPENKIFSKIKTKTSKRTVKENNESKETILNKVVDKLVDNRIKNVMPCVKNENLLSQLGDFRQYQECFEVIYSDAKENKGTSNNDSLPVLGSIEINMKGKDTQLIKAHIVNLCSSRAHNLCIVKSETESKTITTIVDNEPKVNKVNSDKAGKKRVVKKSARRRQNKTNKKIKINASFFDENKGKKTKKSLLKGNSKLIGKSNTTSKDASSKNSEVVGKEVPKKEINKVISKKENILILDKVGPIAINTSIARGVAQDNLEKSSNAVVKLDKIKKLCSIELKQESKTKQPLPTLVREPVDQISEAYHQSKSVVTKEPINKATCNNITKQMQNSKNLVQHEKQPHALIKMDTDKKCDFISLNTATVTSQTNKIVMKNSKLQIDSVTNPKTYNTTHSKLIKSFRSSHSTERARLEKQTSENNLSRKQSEKFVFSSTPVQQEGVNQEHPLIPLKNSSNPQALKATKNNSELDSNPQSNNNKEQYSYFETKSNPKPSKSLKSEVIKTNLVLFDTNDEEARLVVCEQSLGAAVKSDLVDLRSVILEESSLKTSRIKPKVETELLKKSSGECTNDIQGSNSLSSDKTITKPWKKESKTELVGIKSLTKEKLKQINFENKSLQHNKVNITGLKKTSTVVKSENLSKNHLFSLDDHLCKNRNENLQNKQLAHTESAILQSSHLSKEKAKTISQSIKKHKLFLNKSASEVCGAKGNSLTRSDNNKVKISPTSLKGESKEKVVVEETNVTNIKYFKPQSFVNIKRGQLQGLNKHKFLNATAACDLSLFKLKSDADRLSKEYIKNKEDFKSDISRPSVSKSHSNSESKTFSKSSTSKKFNKSIGKSHDSRMDNKSSKKSSNSDKSNNSPKKPVNKEKSNNNSKKTDCLKKQIKNTEAHLNTISKNHIKDVISNNVLTGIQVSSCKVSKPQKDIVNTAESRNSTITRVSHPNIYNASSGKTDITECKAAKSVKNIISENPANPSSSEVLVSNPTINKKELQNSKVNEVILPKKLNESVQNSVSSSECLNVKHNKVEGAGNEVPRQFDDSNKSANSSNKSVNIVGFKNLKTTKEKISKTTGNIVKTSVIKDNKLSTFDGINATKKAVVGVNKNSNLKVFEKSEHNFDKDCKTNSEEATNISNKLVNTSNNKLLKPSANIQLHKFTITGQNRKFKQPKVKSLESVVTRYQQKKFEVGKSNLRAKSQHTDNKLTMVETQKDNRHKSQDSSSRSNILLKEKLGSIQKVKPEIKYESFKNDTSPRSVKEKSKTSSAKPKISIRPELNVPKSEKSYENVEQSEKVTQTQSVAKIRNIAKLVPPSKSETTLSSLGNSNKYIETSKQITKSKTPYKTVHGRKVEDVAETTIASNTTLKTKF